MIINKIYNIDCLTGLKQMDNESVDLFITSPPFWGLRSYQGVLPQIWGGDSLCQHEWTESTKKGITGGIKTSKLQTKGQANFQIVPDTKNATCSKCNAWRGCLGGEPDPERFIINLVEIFAEVKRVMKKTGSLYLDMGYVYLNGKKGSGWKVPKQMALIPEMLAIELQKTGFILRNKIIWHRPNQLPTSSRDRYCQDYNPVFFFVKSGKYFFNQPLEPYSKHSKPNEIYIGQATKNYEEQKAQNPSETKRRILSSMAKRGGRTKRTVWSINSQISKSKHSATFPEKLVEIPILASSKEGDVVCDIFSGTGTTCSVAKRLGRNYIGFELSEEYCRFSEDRVAKIITGSLSLPGFHIAAQIETEEAVQSDISKLKNTEPQPHSSWGDL